MNQKEKSRKRDKSGMTFISCLACYIQQTNIWVSLYDFYLGLVTKFIVLFLFSSR